MFDVEFMYTPFGVLPSTMLMPMPYALLILYIYSINATPPKRRIPNVDSIGRTHGLDVYVREND